MTLISRQWWHFHHSVMTYAGQCNCCRGGFRSRACAASSGCTLLLVNPRIFMKMVIGMRLPTLLTLSIWRQRLWIWQSGWVFPPRSWMRRNSFVLFERLWVVVFLVNRYINMNLSQETFANIAKCKFSLPFGTRYALLPEKSFNLAHTFRSAKPWAWVPSWLWVAHPIWELDSFIWPTRQVWRDWTFGSMGVNVCYQIRRFAVFVLKPSIFFFCFPGTVILHDIGQVAKSSEKWASLVRA